MTVPDPLECLPSLSALLPTVPSPLSPLPPVSIRHGLLCSPGHPPCSSPPRPPSLLAPSAYACRWPPTPVLFAPSWVCQRRPVSSHPTPWLTPYVVLFWQVEHLCALENGGLVSACSDGVLWVRAPDFHHAVSLVGHTDAVHAVAEVEGDTRVVSASSDFTLRVWQTVDGSCEHVLCGHNALVGAVCTVRVGRSSRKIVSGSYDGTLIVWDLDSGEQEAWLDGHWGQVTWVASLGPGARVISTSYDGTLRVWSLDTCTCEAVISCEENRLPWCVTELLLG